MSDLRLAARSFSSRPGFTLLATGMLALGIAGNVSIFSIFNGMFLRPLPFPEPDRLVDLDETAPKWNLEFVSVSTADYYAWRAGNGTFERMAVYRDDSANLSARTPGTEAQRIKLARVTYDMMPTLRVSPVLGRNFSAEEDRPGGARVALLGYDLWQRMFQGSRSVLGQVLELDRDAYTVVGVLPRTAVVPHEAELWIPLQANPADSGGWWLNGIGRLKPGVSIAQARADLTRVHRSLVQTGQKVNEITSPVVTPFRDRHLGNYKPVSVILLGAVGIVLLIACVNVAGLMMVRGAARTREIAIRSAMGASRGRIVRQLLTESLLLALAGGAAGVLLGRLLLRGLVALMPEDMPRWIVFSLDARFAMFAVAVTGAAALLFGLAPALQAARVDASGMLQEAAPRAGMSRTRRGILGALVVGEIGLALVLLAGAGLVLQAFRKVMAVDPGFRPDNVLTFSVSLPWAKYWKHEPRIAFYDTLLTRLRTIPGVRVAGAVSAPPLGGHWGMFLEAEGARKLGPDENTPVILQIVATPGYLDAIGVTLLAGRQFDARDGVVPEQPCGEQPPPPGADWDKLKKCASPLAAGPAAVIINETLAKHFWPGQNPIGKRVRYPWEAKQGKWMEVVGLTRDVKHYGLDTPMRPSVYVPYRRFPNQEMTLVLRGAVNPAGFLAPARRILRELDADLPMFEVRTMTERLQRSLWARRAYSSLFAAFAVVALVLSTTGIYGVVSFAVAQRTHEIGVRMALGARPRQVMAQVLRQGLVLAALGAVLGLATAMAAARVLQSLLFGISPRDPLTYGIVTAGVLATALLANVVPARRAAAIDPMRALRCE